jgi:hypothetical protein
MHLQLRDVLKPADQDLFHRHADDPVAMLAQGRFDFVNNLSERKNIRHITVDVSSARFSGGGIPLRVLRRSHPKAGPTPGEFETPSSSNFINRLR